jgi:hypothetical protein
MPPEISQRRVVAWQNGFERNAYLDGLTVDAKPFDRHPSPVETCALGR